MLPPINLVLLKPFETDIPGPFDDTVLSCAYWLLQAGLGVNVGCNAIYPGCINILFGAGSSMAPPLDAIRAEADPSNTIIFNMEQLDIGNSFVTAEYLDFLAEYRVLDYNAHNIGRLKAQRPHARAVEYPLLPTPLFAGDFKSDGQLPGQGPDAVFFGAMAARRLVVMKELVERGRNPGWVLGQYGKDLSAAIYPSTLCLNIHALDTGIFEIARCLRPLAMGMPIVSEVSLLPQSVTWRESGVHFCSVNEMPDVVCQLLDDPRQLLSMSRQQQHFLQRGDWAELARASIEALL